MHSPLDRGSQRAVVDGLALTQENITGDAFVEGPRIIYFYSQMKSESISRGTHAIESYVYTGRAAGTFGIRGVFQYRIIWYKTNGSVKKINTL